MERNEVIVSEQELARQKEFTRKMREMNDRRTRTPLALVDTFGCQQNVADGEVLMGMLREMGYELTRDEQQADVILLNTCAIREHAEKRVYGTLGALTHTKKANPEQIICLCGCMAQRPEVAEKVRQSYRHVDLVFGPQALWKFPELLYQVYTRRGRVFSVEDEHGSIAEDMPVVREGRTRAWVSIMYGCNNFCSYCIVPYVRGRERSRDPEQIIAEVRQLAAEGYKEITLLGQNVNSYGKDLGTGYDFADLLTALDEIPGDYLIRFMSSQPKDASFKLFDTMARCSHVAKQLHLPVQSGSDEILARMNRKYTSADYLETVRYARERMPEIVLSSDIIVGFPGETEEMFEDTLRLVAQVRYDMLFSFIYSRRKGTPAYSMEGQIPYADKLRRFNRLIQAQNALSADANAQYMGRCVRVLCLGKNEKNPALLEGRTDGNKLVFFRGGDELVGNFVNVCITEPKTYFMFGEIQ